MRGGVYLAAPSPFFLLAGRRRLNKWLQGLVNCLKTVVNIVVAAPTRAHDSPRREYQQHNGRSRRSQDEPREHRALIRALLVELLVEPVEIYRGSRCERNVAHKVLNGAR